MATKIKLDDLAPVGPGTIAGRFLRTFWHPIILSDQLKAGQAQKITLMGEDWTLYRGESGQPHLVANRCAHRSAQLSVGWVEGEAIRCFYHGWKYDAQGQCVEQPAEPMPFCDKIRISRAWARDYLGWIFVWVGEGEPPDLPRYPDFEDFEGELYCYQSRHGINYFNSIDNLLDATHVGFVHRDHAGGYDGRTDSPILHITETSWGASSRHARPSGKTGQTQFGMPNMLRLRGFPPKAGLPPREVLLWVVPVDDLNFVTCFVEAIRMPAADARAYVASRKAIAERQVQSAAMLAQDVVEGRIRREDVDPETTRYPQFVDDIAQLAQGRIHDRNKEKLGRGDVGLRLMRKLWLRELDALANGQPLTEWIYDPNFPVAQSDE